MTTQNNYNVGIYCRLSRDDNNGNRESMSIDGVSTHSFRKFFATQIYINNDYNIVLVQHLLQHSTPAVSQKYIGIQTKVVEQALQKHICLI